MYWLIKYKLVPKLRGFRLGPALRRRGGAPRAGEEDGRPAAEQAPRPAGGDRRALGEGRRIARVRARAILQEEAPLEAARWALLHQELAAWARRGLYVWLRCALVFLVCAAVAAALLEQTIGTGSTIDPNEAARIGHTVFAAFSVTAYILVLLAAPMLAGGSFTREKEEGTFLLLLATPIPPRSIVIQKLAAQAIVAGSLVAVVFPALLCVLPFGGTSIYQVLLVGVIVLATAVLGIAVGIRRSLEHRTTGTAVLVSVLWTVFFANVLFLPLAGFGTAPVALYQAVERGGWPGRIYTGAYVAVVAVLVIAILRRAIRRLRAAFTRFEFVLYPPFGGRRERPMLGRRMGLDIDAVRSVRLIAKVLRPGLIGWTRMSGLILLAFLALKAVTLQQRDPVFGAFGVPLAGVAAAGLLCVLGYAAVMAGVRDRETGAQDLLAVTPIGGRSVVRERARGLAPLYLPVLVLPFLFPCPVVRGAGIAAFLAEVAAVGALVIAVSLLVGRIARGAVAGVAGLLSALAAAMLLPAAFGEGETVLLGPAPVERAAVVVPVYGLLAFLAFRAAGRR